MTNHEPRQISPKELQLLARIAGVEIAPERLERLAAQVTTVFQGIDQLDATELHDVEPAMTFQLPWE